MKCHSTHSAQGKRTLNSEAAHHRLLLPRTFFEYSSQVKESYHVRRCDCTPTYFELTSKDSVAKKQKKTIRVILKQEVTEKQTSNQRKKEQKRRWMSMYRSSFMLASTHTHTNAHNLLLQPFLHQRVVGLVALQKAGQENGVVQMCFDLQRVLKHLCRLGLYDVLDLIVLDGELCC